MSKDYILSMLANFNALFQSQSPPPFPYITLSKNFLEVEYVNGLKNPLDVDVNDDNYYVDVQNIYLGLNAHLAISELVERDPKVNHNKEMKVYLTAR